MPLWTNSGGVELRRKVSGYLFVVPALAFVGIFLIIPVIYTAYYSFTEWDGLRDPQWIGLQNYTAFFRDPAFASSLKNTVIWVALLLTLSVTLSLTLSVIMSKVRASPVIRSAFYVPLALSGVTTGIIWRFVFMPGEGLLNSLLNLVGLSEWTRSWLLDVPFNTYAMIGAAMWQATGLNLVIFLMGLTNLPQEPLEAAAIDGATEWKRFWYITLPLLRPITTVVVGMTLINSLKVFDIIWVMTQGGPYRSSETLAVTMYRESFVLFHMGYGSAIAILLSIVVFLASSSYIRRMIRGDQAY